MRFAAAFVALLAACGSENRVEKPLPYNGEAWPNERPSWTIDKRALAVVSNNASDTLSLLDLAKNQVAATAPIDLDPLATDGPHHVAIDANGEFLFTPLAYPAPNVALGPHAEHGASQVPGVLVKLRVRDLAKVGELTVANNPGDVALSPDGKRVVVTHFDLARAIEGMKAKKPIAELRAPVVVVDAATMTKIAAPSACIAAHGLTFAPDGKTVYLACYGEDAIGVLSLDAPDKVELWPLGAVTSVPPDITFGPYFVLLAPSGKELVVAESEGKSLRFVDLSTRKTTQKVPLDGAVFAPASTADGTRWIVPVQGPDKVVVVDASTYAVVKTRAFPTGSECQKPHQVARKGDRWFVVCEGDHKKPGRILEIDPGTLDTVRSFEVGAYPDVIAFAEGS